MSSSNPIRPRSTHCIVATEVNSFVLDASDTTVSRDIPVLAAPVFPEHFSRIVVPSLALCTLSGRYLSY